MLCASSIKGQNYFYNDKYFDADWLLEASISVGAMNCLTDLGGRSGDGKSFLKDLNLHTTQPCGSLYFGAVFNQKIGFRLEGLAGTVCAYDSILRDKAALRFNRNLHFRSRIFEIFSVVEFYPFAFEIKKNDAVTLLSPYVLAGVGYFHFDPKAKLAGTWTSLQPLHTEGQGFRELPDRIPYRLGQVNFPVGLGIKYEASAIISFRMEIIDRILLTDYLDDVSTKYIDPALFDAYFDSRRANDARAAANRQRATTINPVGDVRGNPSSNDNYFSLQFKMSFTLNRKAR